MFETLLEYFQDSPLSLWGPFGVLILCGLGLPVPEDIVLVVAGALGESDGRSWIRVSAVMYAGVLAGDSSIFFAGRYLGARLLGARWFQRFFSAEKQLKVEGMYARFGAAMLFVARFLPGLRAGVFFSAGSMKVSYAKLLFFDGLAALLSVPLFVWLGHWLWAKFQDDLEQLEKELSRAHSYSLWIAVGIGLAAIAVLLVRNRRRVTQTETK